MSKTWLIIQREYRTRVRNRSFLLSTFLLPVVSVLFIAGTVLVAIHGKTRQRIAVIDANGYFKDYLKSDSAMSFDFSPGLDTLNYTQKGCTAILIIPPLNETHTTICRLKYKKQIGLEGIGDLESRVNNACSDHLVYEKTGITKSRLDSVRSKSFPLTEI